MRCALAGRPYAAAAMNVPRPPPPPDATKTRHLVETSDAQRSKVITLFELGFTYTEIVAKTGVKKTTCWHIVQRDKEKRNLDRLFLIQLQHLIVVGQRSAVTGRRDT